MIIPFGSEQTTVRRLPWVTFAIMGLCLIAFIPTYVLSSSHDEEILQQRFYEIFEYLSQHPYLDLDPRFMEFLRDRAPEEQVEEFETFLEGMRAFGNDPPTNRRKLEAEQEHLDLLVDQMIRAVENLKKGAFFTMGLIPADMKLHALVTHQFLHGGWLHLFGNMLFLFVTAPFLEDVWGRLLFPGFYLMAGIIAAVMFAVHYPDSAIPLIGASGAVAGVMGAFLVRFWKTKIKFIVWVIFPMGPFKAPAWVIFPGWFLWEMLLAQAWDKIAPGSGGGGVAHWAHVWGFAFGLAVAFAVRYYQVEERHINKAIESKITLVDNTAVEKAMDAHSHGRSEEAFELLHGELEANPGNVDAAIASWTVAQACGRSSEVLPQMIRAIQRSARTGDPTLIISHWQDVLDASPDLQVEPALAARVTEVLADHGLYEAALATLERARTTVSLDTAPGVLVRLAKSAASLESPVAAVFVQAALAHPETPAESRVELEAMAGSAVPPPPPPAQPQERPPQAPQELQPEIPPSLHGIELSEELDIEPVAPQVVEHSLQVMEVVPSALVDGTLTIQVSGTTRQVALDQIQALGVGGVQREQQRPYLVVDLLLDPPWSERERLRTLRVLSTSFDPRKLTGVDNSMAAFRRFLDEMLRISEAVPLPDPDAARGNPFRMFSSVDAYQQEVLGIG
jgi:membrane associated rhomboid family serine protease